MNPSATVTGTSNDRALRDDLDALKSDLQTLKEDLRVFASDAGAAARHGARDAAERLRERGKAAYSAGKEKAVWAKDEVQGQIEDHPFASVGIAFGVGLLIGAIIARR